MVAVVCTRLRGGDLLGFVSWYRWGEPSSSPVVHGERQEEPGGSLVIDVLLIILSPDMMTAYPWRLDRLCRDFPGRSILAQPFVALPSGLQRFTSVFGMGTGGATALLSPECGTARAVRCCRSDASAKPSLWGLRANRSS